MASNNTLRLLYQDVKDRFALEGPTANVVFGKREIAKQTNQGPGRGNRVVFVPGDPSGKVGKYEGAKIARIPLAERRIRSLGTLRELATVYCWAWDPDAPNDEAVQYEAARQLHDYVVRAMYRSHNVGHGSYTLSGPQWQQKATERKFGAEIFFLVEFESRILDEPPGAPDTTTTPTQAEGPAAITTDTTTDPPVEETDATDHVPAEP